MTSVEAQYPLRKVLRVTFLTNKYCRPGEGCNRFDLECGHWCIAKQSQGEPKRKRCRDCYISQYPK